MGRKKIDYLLDNYIEDVIYSGIDRLGIYVRIDDYDYSVFRATYGTYVTNSADWTHSMEEFKEFNSIFGVSEIKYTSDFVPMREHNYVNAYITTDEFTIHAFQFLWSPYFIRFTVYGKFFRLCQILDINDPIKFFQRIVFLQMGIGDKDRSIFYQYPLDVWKFYRVDYCIDIRSITVQSYYSALSAEVTKEFKRFSKKQKMRFGLDGMETVYIGSKDSKYAFARIYDKQLDTLSKGHYSLYSDYFQYTDVTRIEFEFHHSFMPRSFNFSDFSPLMSKIKSYIGLEDTWKLPFWSGIRYSKDVIMDKCKYSAKLLNMIVKGSNNGLDFRAIFKEANKLQDNNYFRVRKNIVEPNSDQNCNPTK